MGRGQVVRQKLPKLSFAGSSPVTRSRIFNDRNEFRSFFCAFKKLKPRNRGFFIYLAAPMRQIVVPQSGHFPLVIGLPFLVTLSTGSCISFLALHLTQYASIAISNLQWFTLGKRLNGAPSKNERQKAFIITSQYHTVHSHCSRQNRFQPVVNWTYGQQKPPNGGFCR